MKLFTRRHCALALSLAVLSGCGVFAQPSAVTSNPPLATSAAQAGAIEVSLLTAQAQWRVLAVVADIASYRITLTGSNISGSLVKTCPAPTGGSNKISTRFENLVPGSYSLSVEALAANGEVIGSSTQTGAVTAGQCTYIDLNIKLSDTLVTNSKGSLGARVTIEDGNVVERPIAACPTNDGFTPIDGPCVNVTPTPAPTPTPVATPTPAPTLAPGYVATIAGSGVNEYKDGASNLAGFTSPLSVVRDSHGNLFVSESYAARIRKISPEGVTSTVLSGVPAFGDLAIDANDNLYIAHQMDACIRKLTPSGELSLFAGSGNGQKGHVDGVGDAARFIGVNGIACDAAGNLYVTDCLVGSSYIRKITPAGVVTTVAGTGTSGFVDGPVASARFSSPNDIAVDSNGDLYVTEIGNYAIRKISNGVVSTVASGATLFPHSVGITFGPNHTLLVSDNSKHAILQVTLDGTVTTVAGGSTGFADGPFASAQFNIPVFLNYYSDGNLYVAEAGNYRIRQLKF